MADTISIREYLAKEDAQLATWREREYIRLEIAMDYSEAYKNPGRPDAVGIAGLRWSLLSNRFDDAESNRLKAVLVSMLYAKVLNLDTANRSGLYGRVENVLRKVKESGGWSRSLTAFAKWTLSVPGSERHSIWPWTISDWDSVEARRPLAYEHVGDRLVCFSKTYTATLLGGPVTANAPSGLWLRLDVPDDELIRLLLPSVPLLAVTDFMAHANDDSQAFLAEMLFGVNQYHGAAERVRVGEEALAVGAAIRRLTQPTRSTDASSQAINQQQLTLAPADIAEAKLSQWLGEAIEWFRGLPSWQRITGVAGLMLLAVLVWNQTRDVGCPRSIVGEAPIAGVNISDGMAEAFVTGVKLECMATPGSTSEYEIAVTASGVSTVGDIDAFEKATRFRSIESRIIFEAVSESGVVLATGSGVLRVVRGQGVTDVSARLSGLSDQAVRRVTRVRARWLYDR